MHKPAAGPLVQFVVIAKRWSVRVGESRPVVGAQWVVDGEMCRVLSVQELSPGRVRAYVERDEVVPPNGAPVLHRRLPRGGHEAGRLGAPGRGRGGGAC